MKRVPRLTDVAVRVSEVVEAAGIEAAAAAEVAEATGAAAAVEEEVAAVEDGDGDSRFPVMHFRLSGAFALQHRSVP